MATAYLGLGSNLGEREINLLKALSLLGQETQLIKTSSIYETKPVGYKKQAFFLNMVCQVSTELTPVNLLRSIKQIEKNLGRKPSFRNAPRIIDMGLLDDLVFEVGSEGLGGSWETRQKRSGW